jgi:hypothetical protein
MKFSQTFFCLIISVGVASATTTIKSNPDKPAEVILATVNGSLVYFAPTYYKTTVSWNWQNNVGGNYSDVMLPDGVQDGLNVFVDEYDNWGADGNGSYEIYNIVYRGDNPPDIEYYESGTNSFPGFPSEIGSLSETYYPPQDWAHGGYVDISRNSKATVQLKTGGKNGSKLQNLFGLQASATGYHHLVLDDTITPVPSDSYSIPASNIKISGVSPLDTNGIVYGSFPDNTTNDITPIVNVKYYSFHFEPPNKYKSHFTVFVDMPDPPPGRNLHDGDDFGHAWWKFTTDAPSDAVNKLMTNNLIPFLGHEVGFYPTNNIDFLGSSPGKLENPESDSNKTVTKSFDIGFPDLIGGLSYTKHINDSPGTWNALVFNCVIATWSAGANAGVWLPATSYPEEFGYEIQGIPY